MQKLKPLESRQPFPDDFRNLCYLLSFPFNYNPSSNSSSSHPNTMASSSFRTNTVTPPTTPSTTPILSSHNTSIHHTNSGVSSPSVSSFNDSLLLSSSSRETLESTHTPSNVNTSSTTTSMATNSTSNLNTTSAQGLMNATMNPTNYLRFPSREKLVELLHSLLDLPISSNTSPSISSVNSFIYSSPLPTSNYISSRAHTSNSNNTSSSSSTSESSLLQKFPTRRKRNRLLELLRQAIACQIETDIRSVISSRGSSNNVIVSFSSKTNAPYVISKVKSLPSTQHSSNASATPASVSSASFHISGGSRVAPKVKT